MDEDALVCDFAEVYHLFDYKALPPKRVAALFVGLGDDSRIKRKLSGAKIETTTALLAIIADRLGLLIWQNSKDGQKGRNKPASIYEAIMSGGETRENVRGFSSVEEFEAALNQLRKEE